jgi:hypothetical protein
MEEFGEPVSRGVAGADALECRQTTCRFIAAFIRACPWIFGGIRKRESFLKRSTTNDGQDGPDFHFRVRDAWWFVLILVILYCGLAFLREAADYKAHERILQMPSTTGP